MTGTGRRVVLWRHGRTEWNDVGRFQGQLDPPLDSVGRDQAIWAAPWIAALRPALVLTSDLARATATAAVLEDRVRLRAAPDKRLREIDLGSWQGLHRDEARARFPEEWEAWHAGEDVRRGHGETYAEVAERAVAAIGERLDLVPPDSSLVAVTHGGTARAVIGMLLDLDPASWWRLGPLGNCHWSLLVDSGKGWRLVEHNTGVRPLPEGERGDDR